MVNLQVHSSVGTLLTQLVKAEGWKSPFPLSIKLNGKEVGFANAGVDMTFSFPELVAHAAKTRHSVLVRSLVLAQFKF